MGWKAKKFFPLSFKESGQSGEDPPEALFSYFNLPVYSTEIR